MAEIALKDLKLKFHPTYKNSGGIYWEGWENWQSDCELLGVVLPVYNSGGVLNLLEIKPRDFSGDHGAIALGGSRNAGVKYHLLGGGSLTLKWVASYDKHRTSSSRTLLPSTSDEAAEGSDSALPDGFVPNPAWIAEPRLLLKGWQSTEIPGIYTMVENQECAKMSFDFEDGGFNQDVMNADEFLLKLTTEFDQIEGVGSKWSATDWSDAYNGIYSLIPIQGVMAESVVIPTRWNLSTYQWDKDIQIEQGARVEVITTLRLCDELGLGDINRAGLYVEKGKWHYVGESNDGE